MAAVASIQWISVFGPCDEPSMQHVRIWRSRALAKRLCFLNDAQLLFELLKAAAFRLGNSPQNKEESSEANNSVDPECTRESQPAENDRESESEHEARNPQSRYRNGYSDSPDSVWKDFRDQDPRHWSE